VLRDTVEQLLSALDAHAGETWVVVGSVSYQRLDHVVAASVSNGHLFHPPRRGPEPEPWDLREVLVVGDDAGPLVLARGRHDAQEIVGLDALDYPTVVVLLDVLAENLEAYRLSALPVGLVVRAQDLAEVPLTAEREEGSLV
jgi:hypothetical protein